MEMFHEERVAKHLVELDPTNASVYVVLRNIYDSSGRWNEGEQITNLMRERGIKKTPGRSWIEVDGKTYSFVVHDKSHPFCDKIYKSLEELFVEVRESGYIPDTSCVLHDVEDEEKEELLCFHSEKLALVWGLMNTPSGTPLRIVKNLRMCVDCHRATSIISKLKNRDIIVRDSNRFHHFHDGECSCKGYW